MSGRPVRAVSVVIPVRNEQHGVGHVLDAVARQTFPPIEILVVDGGSTDGTTARVLERAATDARIRLIEAGRASPGRGRNVGIAAARDEWIALTDAGTRPAPDWLEQLVTAANLLPQAEVIFGGYEPVTETFFTRVAALAYVASTRSTPVGRLRGPSVASMLLTREAWRRCGGFPDQRAGEDLVFLDRLAGCGLPTGWAPAAVVWWELQPSVRLTFRRFRIYSRHNVIAGLQRRWHYGVLRQYLAASACVALAAWHDWRWLLVPVAGLLLRAALKLGRWRDLGLRARDVFRPAAVLAVLALLLVIDAATFVGWAQAASGDAPDEG